MGVGKKRSGKVSASIMAMAGLGLLWTSALLSAQATRPARRLASSRPSVPATRKTDKLTVNFKDAPLDSVLDYFSQAAGLEIIKDAPVDKRVNLLSKQPVTLDEALEMLSASLKANGLAAIRQGRELKITTWDKAKKSAIPVHFGADPKDVPLTDELITQVVPIQNVDAAKLVTDLKPLIGDTDMTANEGSNTLVMTDTCANLHRLVEIISKLDQQETTVSEMKVIPLRYASAKDAVKLIDTVFKTEPGAPSGPQPGRPMGPQPGPPQPAAGGSAQRQRGKVISAADERTNTVVVTGPADTLKSVEELLKKLDANPMPAAQIQSFPLRFADAESTSKLITSIFKPPDNNTSPFRFFYFGGNNEEQQNKVKITTAFDERTNTVVVTAPADVLKSVAALIKTLDANPGAASAIRIFPLKYADAYSATKLINSIFNPPPSSSGNPSDHVNIFYEDMGPQPTRAAKVNATEEDRTNAVIVTAPAEMMKVVAQIVDQVDAKPGSEDTLFIYHLRNADSQNLEVVLNTLFGNIQNGQNNQNQNQQQQQQQRQNQSPFGNGITGGSSGGRGLGNNQLGARNRNNNNNRRNNRSQLQPGSAQAVNELTGMVLVVAEPDSNSLVVTTASKYEQEVRQIIAELDRPVPQVLIKVLVAEVTHDNNADFGTDFSILNTRPNGHGQSFGQTFGTPGSGLVVNFLESNLNATLHALAQQNKLDVLSRPYILASDNQEATILVGQDVPIVLNSYTTALGQAVSQYQYQPVGIILDVTPHVNPEGLVTLDVAPEISQLTSQTVNVGPGINVPVIADRSANSRVAIRDGQTIVIGGLMQDQKTYTVNKIPILGDIPVIKYAFSRTVVDKTKTELLIFLTPHVALEPDLLNPMSVDEIKGTTLTPRAVGPGEFDEHMKGLRRGQVPTTQFERTRSPVFVPQSTSKPSIMIPIPSTRPNAQEAVRSTDVRTP